MIIIFFKVLPNINKIHSSSLVTHVSLSKYNGINIDND